MGDKTFDLVATLEAIEVLRDLERWRTVSEVGRPILVRAWRRLEDETREYLTGHR